MRIDNGKEITCKTGKDMIFLHCRKKGRIGRRCRASKKGKKS